MKQKITTLSYDSNIKSGELLVLTLAFMFLPPFIGLPYIVGRIWMKQKKYSYTDYLSFTVCIAAYLAAINATKLPDGDQVQYFYAYKNVPIQGFIGSLINIYGITYEWQEVRTTISGEFMNGVYNYVGYYLTLGYYPFFAFVYTLVEYMLMFVGFYRFCRTLREPHKPFICGVIILSFFYLFFQYTLQIQKQFMAQAIMMFVLGSYAEKGRMNYKLWVGVFCAVFTHASTWLFVPFLIYRPLWGRLNKVSLLLLGVLFALGIYMGPRMVSSMTFGEMGVAGYGLNRLANSEINNDTDEFALVWSQIFVIALPMAWVVFKKLWLGRKTSIASQQAFMLNIVLLILLTVAAMMRQPMAQYRYFMMLLAFMPYVYPFFSDKIRRRDTILTCIAVVMVVWFYYQFELLKWHYADEWEIIVKPPFMLVFL